MNGTSGMIALIGDPVGHSVSPPMQRAAFRASGVDMDYVARRVRQDELNGVWPGLRAECVGLNVTIPLKESIVPLLDGRSHAALATGSVNTVVFEHDAAVGHSTDGDGFMAALRRERDRPVRRAVVLGTGGAARAVAAAMAGAGAAVDVVGRNAQAGRRLMADLIANANANARGGGAVRFVHGPGPEEWSRLLGSADLVVNATPLGGVSDPSATPIPDDVPLDSKTVVFDLVSTPRRTRLLERAAAAGCPTVEGIEMLIEQGARSFELWTGIDAPIAIMREAAYAALPGAGDEAAGAASPSEVR